MPSAVPVPASARGRGADRAVAAADDQQRIAALGDRPAAQLGIAAFDQLDPRVDPGGVKRGLDLRGDVLVGRGRPAAAIEQRGCAHAAIRPARLARPGSRRRACR